MFNNYSPVTNPSLSLSLSFSTVVTALTTMQLARTNNTHLQIKYDPSHVYYAVQWTARLFLKLHVHT